MTLNFTPQNACQTIVNRLEPIRQSNPKGTWKDWIIQAYFQRISLSATGFYKYVSFPYYANSFIRKVADAF